MYVIQDTQYILLNNEQCNFIEKIETMTGTAYLWRLELLSDNVSFTFLHLVFYARLCERRP